jgi:hypothetical protein
MRATIRGLMNERLKGGFEGLDRRRRRVLCTMAYGSGGAAVVLGPIEHPWPLLPALVLFAVCGASYYPLHVVSRGIDYRARPRMPFGGRSRPRDVDGGVDEAQLRGNGVSDLPYARLPVRVVDAGGDLRVGPHRRRSGRLGEQPSHGDLGLAGTRHPRPPLPGRRGFGLTDTETRHV